MDNEEWKDIKGYEGLYQISNFGNIKSLRRKDSKDRNVPERQLKQRFEGKDKKYIHCSLSKNGHSVEHKVHRLVAETFLPDKSFFKSLPYEDRSKINLEKLQINHKDENPSNNRVDNLEWCTNLYNQLYSNATKVNQFDKNGNFIKQWDSIKEASVMLGVTHSAIIACCKEKTKSCKGYIWRYTNKTFLD